MKLAKTPKTKPSKRKATTEKKPFSVISPDVITAFLANSIGEHQDAYLASLAEMSARICTLVHHSERVNEVLNGIFLSQMTDQIKEFKKMRSAVVRMTKHFDVV